MTKEEELKFREAEAKVYSLRRSFAASEAALERANAECLRLADAWLIMWKKILALVRFINAGTKGPVQVIDRPLIDDIFAEALRQQRELDAPIGERAVADIKERLDAVTKERDEARLAVSSEAFLEGLQKNQDAMRKEHQKMFYANNQLSCALDNSKDTLGKYAKLLLISVEALKDIRGHTSKGFPIDDIIEKAFMQMQEAYPDILPRNL